MLLNGLALLGDTNKNPGAPPLRATLPRQEELPLADRQVLHQLPQAIIRRGGYVGEKVAGSARYFCTVLDEVPRVYVSTLALDIEGAGHLLKDYLCVWSNAPEILSRNFLQSFAQLCSMAFCKASGYSVERLIQLWWWLLEMPAPPPGCSLHLHAESCDLPPIGPRPLVSRGLSAPHVPLRFLFERLSLEDVLLLSRLVLLERRVLLRSSSSFVLTACCEALARVLFFPLQWQHFFTPMATQQNLMDKGPWLLGLRRDTLELGKAALTAVPVPDGQVCSIFDLDVGEASHVEATLSRLPELPKVIRQSMRQRLSRLATKAMEDSSFDHEVQNIFFQSLSPLWVNLRHHLHTEKNGRPSHFDAQEYVHSRDLGLQAFCRALVETVAFRGLLCEMDRNGLPLETLADLQPGPSCETQTHMGSVSDSELFQTVKSFQSCSSADGALSPGRSSHVMLVQRNAESPKLELHVYHGPTVPVPKLDGRVLATWARPGPDKTKAHRPGTTGVVDSLAKMMTQPISRQRPQWMQALGSQLDGELAEPVLAAFSTCLLPTLPSQTRELSRESSESGTGSVVVENLKPACFTRPGIRRAESHCSYPSNDDTDGEQEDAHFEEAEASPTILNSLQKCLKTPRHGGLLAAHLLRKAFVCLYVSQAEPKAAKDAKSRKSSKHVRISHAVTTGFEEEDFLSPAGQRRKTLRSMTTSNLSISPTRSFVSPPSISPERERGNLNRRSDPTLLSSNRLSPRRKASKTTQLEKIKCETPQAVTDLCKSFCELQLCNPMELEHEDRQAFWLNVLNACTLAWVCATEPQRLQSNLFPMHVWLGFLQKNLVNIAGQLFSLMDIEHNILRAQSKAPKFGWIFQGQKGFKCETKSRMALEHAAPEVSFGIFYPLRFGCARLQVYYPQVVRDQLLLNCAQHLLETVTVEPKKRRVTLPPLLKYYANDFGGSNGALIHFVQSTLEAAPSLLEELAFDGRPLSESENLLAQHAPEKALMLEQLRKDGDFNQVSVSFSDFDWRLELEHPVAGCWELENLLELAREKKMKVAPPPGRPPSSQPADLRQRRFVQIDTGETGT